MEIEKFEEDLRETVNHVFGDTMNSISETKQKLMEIQDVLSDIDGEIDIMIDSLGE